jgi:hypothetical protein
LQIKGWHYWTCKYFRSLGEILICFYDQKVHPGQAPFQFHLKKFAFENDLLFDFCFLFSKLKHVFQVGGRAKYPSNAV